jgi:hypothetical protein
MVVYSNIDEAVAKLGHICRGGGAYYAHKLISWFVTGTIEDSGLELKLLLN